LAVQPLDDLSRSSQAGVRPNRGPSCTSRTAGGEPTALGAEGHSARRVGAAEEAGQRCPYSRDFSPAFAACPAYQPVSFIAADSWYRPLGAVLTCLHLAVGDVGPRKGRFYPRCALGTDRQRLQWVARVTPERLAIARVLQEEFDRSMWPEREQLFDAKARFLVSPGSTELRVQLEQRAGTFLAACSRFFAERRCRFQEAGLPISALMPLITDWVRAWTESPQVDEASLGDKRRRAFTPTPGSRGRLGPALPPPACEQMPAADGPAGQVRVQAGVSDSLPGNTDTTVAVYEDAILHIRRSADCSTVFFTGEIDGSNVDAVSESLLLDTGGAGDIHVDLNGVSFCDVGGLRAFVRAGLDLAPRRLVLRGLPRHLHTAVQLVGWAELPSLVIRESGDSSVNDGYGNGSVQLDTNATEAPR
jgi:anti-anti-sigma regulatory factor